MGKADWSLDQLERDLGEGFALLGRAERSGGLGPGEASALADGVLRCMNGALQKVSESLDAQAGLRRELAGLRDELRQYREERRASDLAQEERIRTLQTEISSLRQERERMQQTLGTLAAKHAPTTPAEDFLAQPLVLRSPQGDFLGVADRGGQPLCLADFQRMVEQGGGPGRLVATVWDRHGQSWCLTLGVSGPATVIAYAWGDMVTDVIQPFWAIPLLGVAKLGFRDIMGYCMIYFLFYMVLISVAFLLWPYIFSY